MKQSSNLNNGTTQKPFFVNIKLCSTLKVNIFLFDASGGLCPEVFFCPDASSEVNVIFINHFLMNVMLI